MGTAAKPKKNGSNGANTESVIDPAAQLHEIQKLLFGQQISQLENVISEFKSDMAAQLTNMDKKFTQHLDKQKKEFAAQLSDLSSHLDKVSCEHQNREALIEDDIHSLQKSLESFEAQTESAHDALEKQLQDESQKLSDELNAKHSEAIEKLNNSSSKLDDAKVDRNTLADLLNSVANSIHTQA